MWRSTHNWSAGVNSAVSQLKVGWLHDFARIESVTDISNDQGRQVSLEWSRSGHDFLGDRVPAGSANGTWYMLASAICLELTTGLDYNDRACYLPWKEACMIRLLKTIFLLTTILITACSDSGPSAPEAIETPAPQANKTAGLESPAENEPHRIGELTGRYHHARQEALGRRTFRNAHKLERAILRFAAHNDGVFPRDLADRNLAGKTLYAYLPGKKALFNPFTRLRTEPGNQAAMSSGQVGYEEIYDLDGYLIGCRITAMGANTDQYLTFDRYMSGWEPSGSSSQIVND